ncbi:hypothetical protein [Aliarcobacter cibarius]|uniref:Uncharacterized protein n=1 Tax=Aliarcobacter cibarius TaxID=255507 RepID=A0ABY2V551_9BACT|nr:hypothetical protein [Aliarcobacter cibarius]TLS99927.1 hypothetical protein FE247_05190 [Aliarcobacter cibarius]TLT00336.1 hypothetical protein FE245_05620 [Aliarcobacter cibarius]
MNYLVEKNTLTIEPTLALKIGLNESILIKQLHYWLKKSKKSSDGKKWVFNTYKQWQEQLPFFSEKTIQRTIANLKDGGWIETKQMDKNKMNRTNFYTINYAKVQELIQEIGESSENLAITEPQLEEKIPKKIANEGAEFYSNEFLQFWENYPNKHGKKVSLIEFNKLDSNTQNIAIAAALRYAKSVENIDIKFIKSPKNWLKDAYFDDFKTETIQTVQKANPVDILAQKIVSVIEDENIDENIDIFSQMRGEVFIFDENEKNILKNLNLDIPFYREMEFQKGEIKAYLKGVLQ